MRRARKALVQMVTEAYGHHAISSFAKLFDACDDIDGYEFEKLFAQEILGAICPPVINQAGSIESTGYIDVEGVRSSIQKWYPDVVNLNEAFARAECEYLGISMSSNT
jgi:hypothetical protein